MEKLNEALSLLALITGFVIIAFIIAKYTYLIKKAMIEKGLATAQSNTSKAKYIDIGCIVIGLGLGLLTSSIFTVMELSEGTMELLIYGTILIFGGLSLVVAHYMRKKFEK